MQWNKPFLPLETQVYSYVQDEYKKWRPSAREAALMHYIGTLCDELKFYWFGGMSNIILNEVVELWVQEDTGKAIWELNTKSIKMLDDHGNESPQLLNLGRGGASQVTYYSKDNNETDIQELNVIYFGNGQIIRFVPDTGIFKTIKQYGRAYEARQHQSACVYGKYMIAHGGINNYK